MSIPELPQLPAEVAAHIQTAPSPHFRAHVDCEPTQAEFACSCDETLKEVKQLLSASLWFDSVEVDPSEASLLISVQPLERTPYQYSPAHNPAMLLLMLAIPIPSKVYAGYCMTATVPGTGAMVQVDTRRESTAISWSLAPLLNLLPDRSFNPGIERELTHIQMQLIPLVAPKP